MGVTRERVHNCWCYKTSHVEKERWWRSHYNSENTFNKRILLTALGLYETRVPFLCSSLWTLAFWLPWGGAHVLPPLHIPKHQPHSNEHLHTITITHGWKKTPNNSKNRNQQQQYLFSENEKVKKCLNKMHVIYVCFLLSSFKNRSTQRHHPWSGVL